jgi:hypothetical protein
MMYSIVVRLFLSYRPGQNFEFICYAGSTFPLRNAFAIQNEAWYG